MTETQRFVIHPRDRDQGWRVAANCRDAIRRQISELHPSGKAVEIRIGPARKARSLAQNRCLHGWMKAISDWWEDASGQRISPEAWKLWFKREYLGESASQMPDGKVVITVRESSSLSVAEFVDFLNRIEVWALNQDGLELPRGDDYLLAMGRQQ